MLNFFSIRKKYFIAIIVLSIFISMLSLLVKEVEVEKEFVAINYFALVKENHSSVSSDRYLIWGDPASMLFVSRYHYGAPFYYLVKESYPSDNKKNTWAFDEFSFIFNTVFIFIILFGAYLLLEHGNNKHISKQ
jgi:hypothetical protein